MGSEAEGDPEEILASDPDRLTEWVNTKVLYQAGKDGVRWRERERKREREKERKREREKKCPSNLTDIIGILRFPPTRVFYSGTDYESRPMLVFCACQLPDPSKVDYDLIYERILIKLDELVENDYTLVFFSGGAKYRPGWAWLFKSYQQMSRSYKKNLKHLYIVHPSMWARIMIDMMSAVFSNKFYKKLTYIPTLSDLAVHVPLKEMRLPDAVYEYNFKFEPAVRAPPQVRPRRPLMFCRPLEEVMGGDGELPRVVGDCIKHIRMHGLDVEGIFRRSPSSSALKAARGGYDLGEEVDLGEYDEHVAAVLLKLFLRELPSPLFPPRLYGLAKEAFPPGKSTETPEEMAEGVARSGILLEMGGCERELLRAITGLLSEVTHHVGRNGMTSRNLAIVFAPNLTK
ncbi:MAG: Rho GTPase activation protein, partial [Piptocephalis tieghemiana]